MKTQATDSPDRSLRVPVTPNTSASDSEGSRAIGWAEMGLVPDRVIRAGIRRLSRRRQHEIQADDCSAASDDLNEFCSMMARSPIAPVPARANEQHYEVPPAFFALALGQHRKYSCCYWPEDIDTLDDAEAASLRISCERAGIEDGMTVLDLGCGWGSLSLWIARNFPNCKVTSVSNSAPQRQYICAEAEKSGLDNVHVITRDMNEFDSSDTYDRIVSVEMFEHMRNYPELFRRISTWLNPGGKFFMHIFCHRLTAYEFLDQGPADWMSRHFFTGGIMPSADLPLRFQQHLSIESRWMWDGRHYQQTANAWLHNMDQRKDEIMPVLRNTYGEKNAATWFMRWRIFFMACAEMFGLDNGQEWMVGHYLFSRQQDGLAA